MASLQDLLKLYNAAASLMFLTFVLARLGTGHRIHDLEDRAWWYYRSIAVLVCWTHEYFLGNSDPTFAVALLFLFLRGHMLFLISRDSLQFYLREHFAPDRGLLPSMIEIELMVCIASSAYDLYNLVTGGI